MAAQRVVVVDDEAGIRRVLRAYLEREGFLVDEAADGPSALAFFDVSVASPPDLVLLDIGLPGLDGLEVLRQVRSRSDVYVLLVTARAEEVDRLVGLGVGADDYITKPFSPREVVARVKAVLRRPRTGPGDGRVLRFRRLTIDEQRREVSRDGEEIALSALEFELLLLLATSPRQVFTRAQVLEQVWGPNYIGDERVVDVHIRSLRQRLGDDANQPTYIGTVRGVGYRFLGDQR
jgi:DNA-binding response OmpR family regulator